MQSVQMLRIAMANSHDACVGACPVIDLSSAMCYLLLCHEVLLSQYPEPDLGNSHSVMMPHYTAKLPLFKHLFKQTNS